MKKIIAIVLGFLLMLMGTTQAQTLPESATLTYTGPMGLAAVMQFDQSNEQYTLDTVFKIPLYQMQFTSHGSLKDNEFKPLSYQDTRKGKPYAQATFDYENKLISFGKPGQMNTTSIHGSPLDTFSLAWQVGLNQGKMAQTLQFTNGKKVYENLSSISQNQVEDYTLGDKTYPMVSYELNQDDNHYQYNILPDLYHIPAVIRFEDDNNTYELKLKSAVINGEKY